MDIKDYKIRRAISQYYREFNGVQSFMDYMRIVNLYKNDLVCAIQEYFSLLQDEAEQVYKIIF